MEGESLKGLVLLILMPALLLGIIAYTNNFKSITAFAVASAQKEESNVIGTYSILPSFKAKIDYDMQAEYNSIKTELDKMIETCKNSADIGQCLKEESKKLEWDCNEYQDESQEILYDFVDKFNECLNLEEDGVVCRFSFEHREIGKLLAKFAIVLTNEYGRIKVDLTSAKTWTEYLDMKGLSYSSYKERDTAGKILSSVRIILEYKGKKPVIEEAIGVGDDSGTIQLTKALLFYKKDGDARFIDRAEENLFRSQVEIKVVDLPKTKGIKFCAKSKDQKNKDFTYKFAVTFPEPPVPPPVRILKAQDKLKAQNSVVLEWNNVKLDDGTDFSDFDHYNIYCSKESLEDKDTKEIRLGNLKPTISVKAPEPSKIYGTWHVDIDKCVKDSIEDGNTYFFAVTSVGTSGKESKTIVQAAANPVDDLAPGPQKIVLTNSDGKKEIKNSNACMDLPKAVGNVHGDIWVGFYAPEKNEDLMIDLQKGEILTYHLHFAKQAPVTSDLDKCADTRKCAVLSYAPKEETSDYELESRIFNKFREIGQPGSMFEEGETYCFTVVAKDKSGNIIKTLSDPYKFERPSQWNDLESNPVIKGSFEKEFSYTETKW